MYYSSGNYEAFARPKKPEGVDNKSAYIVGSGLAALTAACYLVRDGQMKGEHIHILEKGNLPGGACDGYKFEKAQAELGDTARCEEDVLSYIAFPQVAENFFEKRKEAEEHSVRYSIEQI